MEEEIKKCWCRTSFRSDEPDYGSPRRKTALQALIARYRRFGYIALIFAAIIPAYLIHCLERWGVADSWVTYSLVSFVSVYFLAAAGMDTWLSRGLGSINFAEMNVAEVVAKVYFYRKKHLQFMAILIPAATVLIGWMAWVLADEKAFVYGIIAGAAFGVICGYNVYRKFMKEYKEATKE